MALPVPVVGGGGEFCATPAVMCVPGATTSGFWRPSLHGPRLEKSAMSLALSALESGVLQPSLPSTSLPPFQVACDCTFSAAPTVIIFFAVPGEPTVCAPEPALPAANRITIC